MAIEKEVVKNDPEGMFTLVIDKAEWTSFDALRHEFQPPTAKSSVEKFHSIVAMYLYDEPMLHMGLPEVLNRVVHSYDENYLATSTSKRKKPKRSESSNPHSIPGVNSQNGEDSSDDEDGEPGQGTALSVTGPAMSAASARPTSLKSLVARSLAATPQPMSAVNTVNTEEYTMLVITASSGACFKDLFGNGFAVITAAAVSENLEISLVDNVSSPLSWVFKTNDMEGANRLLSRGSYRVLGHEVVVDQFIQSL